MMSERLDRIVEHLRDHLSAGGTHSGSSLQNAELQRRSFAYGTANIENSGITRDMIDHEADRFNQS